MDGKLCEFKKVTLLKDQELGSGAYGVVCKANCDGRICAAKLPHPKLVGDRYRKQFKQECEILRQHQHPNIIQYLGTHAEPDGTQVLLMELMEENLTSFLERSPTDLPFHMEASFCHDIAQALSFLHSKDIIHRDLSGNNVLLTAGGKLAKVTDFGMAKLFCTDKGTSHLTQVPGCNLYMPPEAFNNPPKYSEKLDIFSFGVVTIQILTHLFPEPGPSKQEVKDPKYDLPIQVPIKDVDRRKNHIELVDPAHLLLPIAVKCLSYQEEDRPTANTLCQQLFEMKPLAEQVRCKCQLVSTGSHEVYQIPKSLVSKDLDMKVMAYDIGTKSIYDPPPGCVLLVVGAREDRTAFLNRLTNHIFGVCWENPYSFVLSISDDQSSYFKIYTFHRMKVSTLPFTLTVVDAPDNECERFTSSQCKKLASTFRNIFSTFVDRIHGILYVTGSGSKNPILWMIQNVFGSHFIENVFFGIILPQHRLPVFKEINEWLNVPVDKINAFDSSILLKFKLHQSTQDKWTWKRGAQMIEICFRKIMESEGSSLLLDKDVMQELKQSEELIRYLQWKVQTELARMSVLCLRNGSNEHFSKIVPLVMDQMAMNCQKCIRTCHFPCGVSTDTQIKCCMMTYKNDGILYCCECHCLATDHVLYPYRYEIVTKTGRVKSNNFELKPRHEWNLELHELESSVIEMIVQVYCSLRKLDDIMRKLNPISPNEYLDYVIQLVRQEAECPVNEACVCLLEGMRKNICFCCNVKIQKLIRTKQRSELEEMKEERWKELVATAGTDALECFVSPFPVYSYKATFISREDTNST